MNTDLLLFFLFWILVFIYIQIRKKDFEVQGMLFALRRTKLGLKAMDSWAKKFPRIIRFLGYTGIVFGFAGMLGSLALFAVGTYNLLFVPGSLPVVRPVIPGVDIPGLPFKLSFFHFLLSIFIIAIVHEFAHGVLARAHGIGVKSSGFAFLGPIPAAFVEPDEDSLSKA